MSVDININCDKCENTMKDMDEVYCDECYEELKDIIAEREREITKLKNTLKEIDDYNQGL
jgi:Zn finger protein HypA/HybF involved in hydrogenase expression